MEYSVVRFRDLCPESYRSMLSVADGVTLFHWPEWLSIYEEFSAATLQYMVCAHDGPTLIAAMPVTVFRKLGSRAVFSSGFSAYGGPIARHGCDSTVVDQLCETFGKYFIRPRTLLANVRILCGNCETLIRLGFSESTGSTHLVALPESTENFDNKFGSAAKWRKVRQSSKKGVIVSRAYSASDFDDWKQLCSENYASHGRRPYPESLYRAVFQGISRKDAIWFHVAKRDNVVIGGTVHVCAGGVAFYWMSATHYDYRDFGVNDALIAHVMREAISCGCRTFDLGASPLDAKGLSDFKERWGGVATPVTLYDRSSILGRLGAAVTRNSLKQGLSLLRSRGTK